MTGTTLPEAQVLTKEPERKANPARERLPRRRLVPQIVLYVILIAIALVYIYPFLVQVATSFKTDAEAAVDPISLIPKVVDDGGVRTPVPEIRLPALVHELGDRHGVRHRRSRVLRFAGRLRTRPAATSVVGVWCSRL